MKYIITEKQYKVLSEIHIQHGTWDFDDSYIAIFTLIKEKVGEDKIKRVVKDYIKNELGYHLTKFKKSDVENYVNLFPDSFSIDNKHIPPELQTNDVLSNLAYYLVKRFFKLRKLGELEYFIETTTWGDRNYFFFDSELEQSVGSITIKKVSDFFGEVKFPDNSWAVRTAGIDSEAKGTGLGKQMYLAILDDVDVLFCDSFLYEESLNIWVNVLPKYVYVGAVFNNVHRKPVMISRRTKLLDLESVKRYFATKRPELIKFNSNESKENITESRRDKVMTEYFNELFNVDEINWSHPLEFYGYGGDRGGEEYVDETRTKFYIGPEFNDDIVFYFYEEEYFSPDSGMKDKCPLIVVEDDYKRSLDGYFGDSWHELFKKWFKENFGLEIKTIDTD
jgi:hypothetical protein